jgi:citronellol/citronellal dehydrogenase
VIQRREFFESSKTGPAMTYKSIFRSDAFAGQRIVVTGGGSGIGRCTAHELASLGAFVALVGRNQEKLQAVAKEISEAGYTPPTHHACDIRDEKQVTSTIAGILESGTPIDGLVNNAGGQFIAPLKDISLNGWEAVVRTNLTGGFLMARECYRATMEAHGGAIVNILADMWHSMPGMGHSGAARAGMLNLTQTAAIEWASSGVRVNAVAPGWIASAGLTKYPETARPMFQRLQQHVPLKRFGTESEVSAAIVFLLSEAAAFISGSCLRVDGAVPNARPDWDIPDHGRSKPYRAFALESEIDFLDSKTD